jgi:hypothetical protein
LDRLIFKNLSLSPSVSFQIHYLPSHNTTSHFRLSAKRIAASKLKIFTPEQMGRARRGDYDNTVASWRNCWMPAKPKLSEEEERLLTIGTALRTDNKVCGSSFRFKLASGALLS